MKRLIGRRFKDSTVQKDIKLLPYAIVTGLNVGVHMSPIQMLSTFSGPKLSPKISESKSWSMESMAKVDKASKPMISVKVKGEEKVMAPEEVSSMVLTKMKALFVGIPGRLFVG